MYLPPKFLSFLFKIFFFPLLFLESIYVVINVANFIPETLDNNLYSPDEVGTLLFFPIIIAIMANLFTALTNHQALY